MTGRPLSGFVSSRDVGIAREGEGLYNPMAGKLHYIEKSSVAGQSTIASQFQEETEVIITEEEESEVRSHTSEKSEDAYE